MKFLNWLKSSKGKLYILISLALWIMVEYITVWHGAKFKEWLSHMPYPIIQYLFIILIFWYFIFIRQWSEKRIFIVILVVMYVFEFLWQNFLLLNIFWFIPGSLLLISIWGFLTFIPLWLVKKSIKRHKWQTIFYCLWILVSGFLFLANLLAKN